MFQAWSWSSDGKDKFTTVYPNFNLLNGTKDFSGSNWENLELWQSDGTYNGLTVRSRQSSGQGLFKRLTISEDGDYVFSTYVSATNGLKPYLSIGKNGSAFYYGQISKNPSDMTRVSYLVKGLKVGDVVTGRLEKGTAESGKLSIAGHKWEKEATATPWMPLASEVVPADYPGYIGKYIGEAGSTQSTNPLDYDWFKV